MPTWWRTVPPGLAFLWEQPNLGAARWHAAGEGPVQYLADTPAGAWAELLRHEEIVDPADVAGLARDLWAIEVPEADVSGAAPAGLGRRAAIGSPTSYPGCQDEARRLRAAGATAIVARSAALRSGAAAGWYVEGGLRRRPSADARVLVLSGPRPDLTGHRAVAAGHPPAALVADVRPLHS